MASSSKKKKKQRSDKQPAGGIKQTQVHGLKKASTGAAVVKGEKKKPVSSAGPIAGKPKDNLLTKTTQFLREVKVELKKVTWPSRKQTIGSTVVVIALVMIISIFLGAIDLGLSSLIRIVLQ